MFYVQLVGPTGAVFYLDPAGKMTTRAGCRAEWETQDEAEVIADVARMVRDMREIADMPHRFRGYAIWVGDTQKDAWRME